MSSRLFLVQILIGCVFSMIPLAANAGWGGRVELYSDGALSQCTLTDTGPGVGDIYVFHRMSELTILDGTVGIMFRLGSSAGFTGTWLEDIIPSGLLASGTSQSGIIVGDGCWHDTDVIVLHARYQMLGTSQSCSFIEVLPRPGYPWIETVTCGFGDFLPVDGDRIQVNPDASCPCEIPVATESTTWGRIKAIYRN